MRVYRLEKDGFGPATHPKHGWKTDAAYPHRRVLYKFIKRNRIDRWDRIEPHLCLVNIAYLLKARLKLATNYTEEIFQAADDLRFACKSRQQLIGFWSVEFYRECRRLGFEMVEYIVPDDKVMFDSTYRQCAFLMRDVLSRRNLSRKFSVDALAR